MAEKTLYFAARSNEGTPDEADAVAAEVVGSNGPTGARTRKLGRQDPPCTATSERYVGFVGSGVSGPNSFFTGPKKRLLGQIGDEGIDLLINLLPNYVCYLPSKHATYLPL